MPASCYDEGGSEGSRRRSGLGSGDGVVLDNQPNPATIAGIARFRSPGNPRSRARPMRRDAIGRAGFDLRVVSDAMGS